MKLKSLEIQGFKSFDDKTILKFDDVITGIVGPNGCGKSNIVDAIRWVIGEQSAKHLRGRAMEDVIFSGTQNRASNSLAQVELTLVTDGDHMPPQYSGCKEISVGRKLYRTGESEYYINKQPVRLKDVTDFFLGTGVGTKAYSIIEQGRVGQVIMAKPEERRRVIEEAAGISKFKTRKEAAQRKMEATTQNLSRLSDILAEIERQKITLERQAKKAEKYKVIRDELMELDLKLASLSFQKLNSEQQTLLTHIKEFDGKEQNLQNTVTENEAWIESERLKLLEIETLLNDLQQEVFEWDNSLKLSESKLQTKKEESNRLEREVSQEDEHIQEISLEIKGSKNGLEQVNEKLAFAELDCAELDHSVVIQEEKFKETEEASQELFALLEKSRDEFNTSQSKLSEITARRENIQDRLKELESTKQVDQVELEELTKKSVHLDKLLKGSKNDLNEIKQLKLSLGEKTDTLTESLKIEEEKNLKEKQELESLKEELLQKKSRLQSLQELEKSFEGYHEGPRQILKRKNEGEFDGILDAVADIIETDSKYESAVSAVLGERMQYLVVNTHADGVRCAELLKTEKVGRSSFIPISVDFEVEQQNLSAGERAQGYNVYTENYLEASDQSGVSDMSDQSDWSEQGTNIYQCQGVEGYLNGFVNLKSGYEKLLPVLFGDVVLVDNVHNAIEAWLNLRKPVVTLDGEFVSKDGTLTGGTLEDTSKALLEKKREIKDLTDVIQEMVDCVKAKEEICFDLNRKIQNLKSEIENIKTSNHEEDLKLAKQEKDILHFNNDLESINARRGKLSQQIFNSSENIDNFKKQLEQLEADEQKLKDVYQSSKELLENKKSDEERYRKELSIRQEKLTKEKIQLAQFKEQIAFLTQEVDRLIAQKARLLNELIRHEENKALLIKRKIFAEDRAAFLEKNIKRIIEKKDDADKKYHERKDEFEVLNAQISERDHQLKEERRNYSQIKDDLNKSTVRLTELRGQLSRLSEQMLERYQLHLSEVYEQHIPDLDTFDVSECDERAYELRGQLSKIGNVNLAAIDELEEIAERFEFLDKQRVDLEESLAALERAIHKINKTTKERFSQTFELVNEKFTKLFPRLFKGGHAYLQMTNPEDVLETGIEIIAQPPGKKLQSISLLSGGEKALTAVSLLFAIFLIKPAPFCLLDEVDAPLDDANVDRYNDIVKEMSQRTQFIVITHNKRTMQVTDCLFGVTMQEAGVSQLVSVQMT